MIIQVTEAISDCDCHRLMMMYDQHAHLSEIRDQMNDILQVGPTKPSLQARLAWKGSAISGMRDSVIEPHSPDRPIWLLHEAPVALNVGGYAALRISTR